ncbi:MAG: ABC transporter permease [Pirellulales bacterium]|nr:ABC transporter permease [Pirellulales bacterium]
MNDLAFKSQVAPGPVIVTLAERELVRFFRQRNRVVGALVQPIMFWLLFSAGLRSNDLGFEFFFPGTLAMILLFTAIFATILIIEDRSEGFLQSVLVAPAPRWAMVLGKIVGGAAIAMLQALLFLALGWLTLGLTSSLLAVLCAILFMALIAVALTALGFFIAWRMDSTQGFHAIMSVFLFPMWLLSGSLFPDEPGSLLTLLSRFNPLTYGVAGLRHYLQFEEGGVDVSALPSLPICWFVTLVFAVVMLTLSWRIAGTRTTGDLL